jgi:hypothetical protein
VRTRCSSNLIVTRPPCQAIARRDVSTRSTCAPVESVFKLVAVRTEVWMGELCGADVMPSVSAAMLATPSRPLQDGLQLPCKELK